MSSALWTAYTKEAVWNVLRGLRAGERWSPHIQLEPPRAQLPFATRSSSSGPPISQQAIAAFLMQATYLRCLTWTNLFHLKHHWKHQDYPFWQQSWKAGRVGVVGRRQGCSQVLYWHICLGKGCLIPPLPCPQAPLAQEIWGDQAAKEVHAPKSPFQAGLGLHRSEQWGQVGIERCSLLLRPIWILPWHCYHSTKYPHNCRNV